MEARNANDCLEQITTAHRKRWGEVTLTPGTYVYESLLTWPALENFTIHAEGVIFRKSADWPGASMVANGWKGVRLSGLTILGSDTEAKTLELVKKTNAAGTEPTVEQIGCAWQINNAVALELERVHTHGSNVGLALVQALNSRLDWLTHTGHWSGKYPKLTTEENVLDKVNKDLARSCYGLKVLGGADLEIVSHRCFDAGGAILIGSNDGSSERGYGLPTRLTLTGCEGAHLGDHGIYISSAEAATVDAAKYSELPYGNAAKARGSNHTLKNSTAVRCHAGFGMEPLGQQHSYGGKITGNLIVEVTTYPLFTDDTPSTELDPTTKTDRAKRGADGKPLIFRVEGVEIIGNSLRRCCREPRPSRATATAPVRETWPIYLAGGSPTVRGNTFTECGGAAEICYQGDDGPYFANGDFFFPTRTK